MRQFYWTFPITNTLCSQLNWSQYKLLIRIKDGDILVFKFDGVLTQAKYRKLSDALHCLKKEIKEKTGYEICTVLLEQNLDLSLYRPVEKGG